MKQRCICTCHQAPDGAWRADGVDVRDPIEAAAACGDCRKSHCAALSDYEPTDNGESTPPRTDYLPPIPWTGDGEEGG